VGAVALPRTKAVSNAAYALHRDRTCDRVPAPRPCGVRLVLARRRPGPAALLPRPRCVRGRPASRRRRGCRGGRIRARGRRRRRLVRRACPGRRQSGDDPDRRRLCSHAAPARRDGRRPRRHRAGGRRRRARRRECRPGHRRPTRPPRGSGRRRAGRLSRSARAPACACRRLLPPAGGGTRARPGAPVGSCRVGRGRPGAGGSRAGCRPGRLSEPGLAQRITGSRRVCSCPREAGPRRARLAADRPAPFEPGRRTPQHAIEGSPRGRGRSCAGHAPAHAAGKAPGDSPRNLARTAGDRAAGGADIAPAGSFDAPDEPCPSSRKTTRRDPAGRQEHGGEGSGTHRRATRPVRPDPPSVGRNRRRGSCGRRPGRAEGCTYH
jgi:hypothetical protein